MIKARVNKQDFQIEFDPSGKTGTLNGKPFTWDKLAVGELTHIILNDKSYQIVLEKREGSTLTIRVNGKKMEVETRDKMTLLLESMGLQSTSEVKVNHVKAPMPGLVIRVLVEPGQEVKKGDALLVLEAMKMENMIKSPSDAVVSSIDVDLSQAVEKNQVLVSFS
jgi:acetyl/propionyl-CoA carboxylase alpha subunit